MGVCCIVFDIDGMLFEFVWIFKYWNKKITNFVFFQNFMFSSRFMPFPTFNKKKNFYTNLFLNVGNGMKR